MRNPDLEELLKNPQLVKRLAARLAYESSVFEGAVGLKKPHGSERSRATRKSSAASAAPRSRASAKKASSKR